MKNISKAELVYTVNGATVTPELSRHFTKKKNGNHVTLRIRKDRKVLAYLSTELYALAAGFHADTKQLLEPVANEKLRKLFTRACKLVATTTEPTALKTGWERELKHLEREQKEADNKDLTENYKAMFKGDSYVSLINKRMRLEKELRAIEEQIAEMEKDGTIKKYKPSATLTEVKNYEAAMKAFLKEHESTLSKRDYAMWSSWLVRLNETAKHAAVTLTLHAFDLEFYAYYKNFLMGVKGNKLSTFGAHVKKLKSFLKWSEADGYDVGKAHKSAKFAIVEEQKTVVYLGDDELDMLWNFKQVKPEYSKQIDLCLFQSLTGLRISDAAKPHHVTTVKVKGGTVEYLTGKCKKTNGTYKVPFSLDNRIKEILQNNGYNMAIVAEQYYNRTIKTIVGEMYAHHNLEVPTVNVIRETLAGTVETLTPKNLELGTHSNRRSFVSRHINSIEFNHLDVLEMLGSTDMKELQKYISVDSGALNDKAAANATTRQSKR